MPGVDWEDVTPKDVPVPVADGTAAAKSVYPDLNITSNHRDPSNPLSVKNPNSDHVLTHAAIDAIPPKGMTFDEYVQGYKDAGYHVLHARDEVTHPIPGLTTGPHWHVVIGATQGKDDTDPNQWQDVTPADHPAVAGAPPAAQPVDPYKASAEATTFSPDILPNMAREYMHSAVNHLPGVLADFGLRAMGHTTEELAAAHAKMDQEYDDYDKAHPQAGWDAHRVLRGLTGVAADMAGSPELALIGPGKAVGVGMQMGTIAAKGALTSLAEQAAKKLAGVGGGWSDFDFQQALEDGAEFAGLHGLIHGAIGSGKFLGDKGADVYNYLKGHFAEAHPGVPIPPDLPPGPVPETHPNEMTPEQKAAYQDVLHTGTAEQIMNFKDSSGHTVGGTLADAEKYIQARDAGTRVSDQVNQVNPDGTPISRSGNEGNRAADLTSVPRTAEQEAAYQQAVSEEADLYHLSGERLAKAMTERDFQADVKQRLAASGHNQDIVYQPAHVPDSVPEGIPPPPGPDGQPLGEVGSYDTQHGTNNANFYDTADLPAVLAARGARAPERPANVVKLDRDVAPGDFPEDAVPGQPVNDNRFDPDVNGRKILDARYKYLAEKPSHNKETNDNLPTDPYETVSQAENAYSKLVFHDKRFYEERGTEAREQYEEELAKASDKYKEAARRLFSGMSDEELTGIVESGQRSSVPSDVAAREVLAERSTVGAGEPPAPPPPPGGPGGPGEPPEEPPEDPVQKFTRILKEAGAARIDQDILAKEARAKKYARMMAAKESGAEGEDWIHAQLGALKGADPKVKFEPVREQFTPEDVQHLVSQIKTSPDLRGHEGLRAGIALMEIMDGKVPTPGSLSLLARVFPPEFIKEAMKRKVPMDKWDIAGNIANLPRSIMSSWDLSAPFRQGIFLVGRKEFWTSFSGMFKSLGSERAFGDLMQSIRDKPSYDLMDKSGLYLAERDHGLGEREEHFMSQWANYIPGNRASERAFIGYLNKLRADTFESLVNKSVKAGIDFEANPKALTDIASFVNNATGRGSLGKFSQSGPLLNATFFAPRLVAARATMLNPMYYAQLSPVVRREAIKSLLSFGAIATTVLGLASAAGMKVQADPRSSDFGKIQDGNTRYDILGGFGQYITLGARLWTNQKLTAKDNVLELGSKYGAPNRLDVIGSFGVNKMAPIPSFVADYFRGKDPVGQPFSMTHEVASRFLPLFTQDAYDVIQDKGWQEGIPKSLPGVFGVGMQTYDATAPYGGGKPVQWEDVTPPQFQDVK